MTAALELWRLVIRGERAEIETIAAELSGNPEAGVLSVSAYTEQDGARCEVYFANRADAEHARNDIASARLSIILDRVSEADWRDGAPSDAPVWVGKFLIAAAPAPMLGSPAVPIALGRSEAFGRGDHPSTQGCLLAIERLAERAAENRTPRHILDVGCGSGILSIAAAKIWPDARVAGVDIDPAAPPLAEQAATDNGVGERCSFAVADGAVGEAMAYDLAMMNILAGPIAQLFPGVAARMRPDGAIVIAGFYQHQSEAVFASVREAGWRPDEGIDVEGWITAICRLL